MTAPDTLVPDTLVAALRVLLGEDAVQTDERVTRHTTWRVGGPARVLCVAHSAEQLRGAVALVRAASPLRPLVDDGSAPSTPEPGDLFPLAHTGRARSAVPVPWGHSDGCSRQGRGPEAGSREVPIPLVVLGRGSNVLIDDAGVDGVVILNRATSLTIEGTTVWAESGVLLSKLAQRTVAAGLVGLEWCHDIPGSVGGAIVNNAGANGGAMSDALQEAHVLLPAGDVRALSAADLAFGYRHSLLRDEGVVPAGARPVVLGARFTLRPGDVSAIKESMAAQRERRKRTQPGGASAGSVFKNPRGDYAGRLIESLGLKGTRVGDAVVSPLHANFILTGPRATATDVLRLVALVRRRVRAAYGIILEPEVQFVYHDGRIGPPPLEDI